jgi:pyruvate/2-oxoglutarate dehydrogenase complex dihydrolipoamide acyltransferase (E2) component
MSSPATDRLVDVPMPQMGTSIAEGEVIAWLKAAGEPVDVDEPLCEISTDKVDSECPSPAAGTVAEILVEVGEVVEVGAVMARIAVGGDAPPPEEDAPVPAPAQPPPPEPGGRNRFYSPVARRLAQAHGVDLDGIEGSGIRGRVTKRDVERAIAEGVDSVPPLEVGAVTEPLSRMRRAIGTAMRRSLDTAATCHTVIECDVSTLEQRRRELGVTALPLLARAVVATLRDFPNLNATLTDTTITRFERVHLGIAVSLGDDGLIVPVVRDAQELSVEGLSRRIEDLAARARSGDLSPEEVRGATFTITNPGRFGASIATPVIDLPQVAILDLEAVVRRPVVVLSEDGTEGIAIRSMVNLVLGWDHRAIDGVYAAGFLAALRDVLRQPSPSGHAP